MVFMDFFQPAQMERASLVVIVPKMNKTLHFCVNYCKLSAVTIQDSYPILRIHERIYLLGDAMILSALKASSNYGQVETAEEDRYKTAFKTHHGLSLFTHMLLGLKDARETFQKKCTSYWRKSNGDLPLSIETISSYFRMHQTNILTRFEKYWRYYAIFYKLH